MKGGGGHVLKVSSMCLVVRLAGAVRIRFPPLIIDPSGIVVSIVSIMMALVSLSTLAACIIHARHPALHSRLWVFELNVNSAESPPRPPTRLPTRTQRNGGVVCIDSEADKESKRRAVPKTRDSDAIGARKR